MGKLRVTLMDTFKGQFLVKVQNYDKRLDLQDKRLTGRQIAWLVVQKFEIEANEGSVLTYAPLRLYFCGPLGLHVFGWEGVRKWLLEFPRGGGILMACVWARGGHHFLAQALKP